MVQGKYGNVRPLLLMTDSEDKSLAQSLASFLASATTNPIYQVTFESARGHYGSFPGDAAPARELLRSSVDEHQLNGAIVVAQRKACSLALLIGSRIRASAVLLIEPTSRDEWVGDDLKEIEARTLVNQVKNFANEHLHVTFFIRRESPGSRILFDSGASAIGIGVFAYGWQANLSSNDLQEYFLPMIALTINMVNYGLRGSNVRVFDENLLPVVAKDESKECVAEIEMIGDINGRLAVRGNAQFRGVPANKYGRQHVKVVLVGSEEDFLFAVGPIKNESLTFRRWSVGQHDYSVSGFDTFGGLGLDISQVPPGKYDLALEVKNNKNAARVFPFVKQDLEPTYFFSRSTLTLIENVDERIVVHRNTLNSVDVREIHDQDLLVTFDHSGIDVNLASNTFVTRLVSGVERLFLLLMGNKNRIVEFKFKGSTSSYSLSFNNDLPLGEYSLALTTGKDFAKTLYDLKTNIVISGEKREVLLLDTMLSGQLVRFLKTSCQSTGRLAAHLLELEDLRYRCTNGKDQLLVIDLLDFAVSMTMDSKGEENIEEADGSPVKCEDPYDSRVLMDASSAQSSFRALVSMVNTSSTTFYLNRVKLPNESVSASGARLFHDRKLVDAINSQVRNLEDQLLSYPNVKIVDAWKRGMRCVPDIDGRFDPYSVEALYFGRLERMLLANSSASSDLDFAFVQQ